MIFLDPDAPGAREERPWIGLSESRKIISGRNLIR